LILIIGATGATGSETVRQLVRRGAEVRAVTRDPAKAAEMPSLARAEIVSGDPSKPETLNGAFRGVERAYLVPPTAPAWDELQAELIERARREGVKHLVRMSAIGAGPEEPSMSLRFHWRGEKAVEASGLAYTHIRSNSFHQNTLLDAETLRAEGRFYGCVGDARFAKVDTRDVGEVIAKVLTEEGHEGRTYELTGPEALTYDDMAARLSGALRREIEYVDMPPDDYAGALAGAGLPGWLARELADLYGRGFYRAGGASFVTDTVERLLGRPPRSYDEFARDHADAFRGEQPR
jgi:uncharacterized protein YbjT (DUF2867 family)